jgi:hypothetical protein
MAMNRDLKLIPEHLLYSLRQYAEHGVATGDFLRSCIANDFSEAACKAAKDVYEHLPAIGMFIRFEMPTESHGSYELYELWRAQHASEDIQELKGIKNRQTQACDAVTHTRRAKWR